MVTAGKGEPQSESIITGIRRSLRRFCTGLALAISFLSQTAGPVQATGIDAKLQATPRRPISIEDMIEVNTPSEVAISPNGRWVAYVLHTAAIESNNHLHDVYVVPTDGSLPPRRLTHNQPRDGYFASLESISAVWAPTSDKLVYVGRHGDETELRSIDVESGREELLVTSEILGGKFNFSSGFSQGRSIEFSPDGRSLAFLASMSAKPPPAAKPLHAIDADENWDPGIDEGLPTQRISTRPVAQLFTLDLSTHRVRMVTSAEFNISDFSWSPNSRSFALEAETDPAAGSLSMRSAIFLVDTSGGALRPLVQIEGINRTPVWSPDGKQIAFCTQHGRPDWMQVCSLAVVSVDGHSPPRNLGAELDRLAGSRLDGIHWVDHGHYIDVLTRYYLSMHLFRISIIDGSIRRLSTRDDRLYDEASYSRDGKIIALRVQGVGVPPDVYISPVTRFRPRALTHLNPSWDTLSLPKAEIVQWRSQDDRWDLHGLLIKPSNYDSKRRYPMLTEVLGGPLMVRQYLNPDVSYPVLALAELGYVIFMPDSRGREGFGLDFTHAIRDERSYVLKPETDVFSGVNAMVARDIADPEQLGILGFSYGGTLTAYAVTLTDRFKAAIYGEGLPDMLRWYETPNTHSGFALLNDMMGFGNPYEPKVIASGIEQSSLFHLDRVHTPVLVEAGELSGWKWDRAYYRGLRHFQVPSEFYVYPRSGHGWDEPRLRQDSFQREIAWFDYWVKGKPYPDVKKQEAYDAWKRAHGR